MSRCLLCRSKYSPRGSWSRYCLSCSRVAVRIQSLAGQTVLRAVRKGLLPPVVSLVCVDCGAPAAAYDHRDYSKHLEVEPVCVSCNGKRGPGLFPRELRPDLYRKPAVAA